MLSDPKTSALPLGEGTVLAGRYRLSRRLARGGMADVYEAHDAQLDRPVAVKVFRAAEPADRGRFEAEAHLLASLNHPNLVAVYDAGEHDEAPYIVLELVTGPTLRARLAEHGPQPSDEVARLGAALAAALAHVHDRGIVHRDLTPANVLCGPGGAPKLTDFGIARVIDTTRVTAEHLTVGTAGYMAPEQVAGGDITPAADVYSLGLVLLEALTGAPAFQGPSHEVVVARLTRDPEIPPLEGPWSALLAAMTARDPEARPPADHVAQALLGGGAIDATASSGGVGSLVVGREADADPEAATAAMAAVGGPPPVPPDATQVMPAVLRPDDAGSATEPSPPPLPQPEAHPVGRVGPALATSGSLLASEGRAIASQARRVGPTAWATAGVALVVALLVAQSGQGSWLTPSLERQLAEAAASDATTTTEAPTTTTAPPETTVAVEGSPDERGERDGGPPPWAEGEGRGQGRGGDDDDDDD